MPDVALPDGVVDLPEAAVASLLREGRAAESRRREEIGVVRKRLREVESALQTRSRAQDARAGLPSSRLLTATPSTAPK